MHTLAFYVQIQNWDQGQKNRWLLGERFNNTLLTPNISTLTAVQQSCASLGFIPLRRVEIFLRTGSCQVWTVGSSFAQAPELGAGDLGILVCVRTSAAGLLFNCKVGGLVHSQGQESLRGCKAHKAVKVVKFCLLICHCPYFGPVELWRGYFVLLSPEPQRMEHVKSVQSGAEFGVHLLFQY